MNTRFFDLRVAKNLSQSAIASSLNCSQRMYSRYERGEVNIPLSLLVEMAKYHHTSIDYLLNLTDIPNSDPQKKRRGSFFFAASLFYLFLAIYSFKYS